MKINFKVIRDIINLTNVNIKFTGYSADSKKDFIETFNYFNKRHRLKFIRNKTVGVALIDINSFKDFGAYYKSVNGKNSAAYYARKCSNRDYLFKEINRNYF